jgi:hypothetical protein
LAKCSGITRSGERCKGVAIDGSGGLCYSHSPEHEEDRRRAASKGGKRGGRGRPVVEVSNIKQRLEELAEDVLEGNVDRSDAAVAGQLYNYALRAIGVGLKAKEQEELKVEMDELREILEQGQGSARGHSWGS